MRHFKAAMYMKSHKLPDLNADKKFEVYWNLQKKLWSVRDYATKRVVTHEDEMYLYNPIFRVQQGGNKRVRDTGVKNVHAYVQGYWDGPSFEPMYKFSCLRRISYNPYKHNTFVWADTEKPVFEIKHQHVFFNAMGQLWVHG